MFDISSMGENKSSEYFLDVLRSRTIVDSVFAHYSDIREFFQTNRKPGVTCLDNSIAEEKNGAKYSQDPIRNSCMEEHQGNSAWCIVYNRKLADVPFGAFVQCAGKIR